MDRCGRFAADDSQVRQAASSPKFEAARLKALAILGNSRSQFAPGIPALAESGVPGLQDVHILGWTGVLAAAATPRAKVAELNAEILKIMFSAAKQAYMKGQRLQIYPLHTAEDFSRQIKAQLESWKELARAAKVEAIQQVRVTAPASSHEGSVARDGRGRWRPLTPAW